MRSRIALALAIGAAAASLAGAPAEAAPAKSCFWARTVTNFRSIDNRTVYVQAAGRSVYELKLFAPCLDVDWSQRILLRSHASASICEGTGNAVEVVVRSGLHHQHCPVTGVRKLTEAEVKALPPAARP